MSVIRNPNTYKHLLHMSRAAILSVAARAATKSVVETLTPEQRLARLEVLRAEVDSLIELEQSGEPDPMSPAENDDDPPF